MVSVMLLLASLGKKKGNKEKQYPLQPLNL